MNQDRRQPTRRVLLLLSALGLCGLTAAVLIGRLSIRDLPAPPVLSVEVRDPSRAAEPPAGDPNDDELPALDMGADPAPSLPSAQHTSPPPETSDARADEPQTEEPQALGWTCTIMEVQPRGDEPSHRPVAVEGDETAYVLGTNTTGARVGYCLVDKQIVGFRENGADLEPLEPMSGGAWSVALGVSGAGEASGSSADKEGREKPVMWLATGEVLLLDTQGGERGRANAINGDGVVLGWVQAESGKIRAVMWDRHGNPMCLNDHLGDKGDWELEQAIGFDDEGRVLALGVKGGRKLSVALSIRPAIGGESSR